MLGETDAVANLAVKDIDTARAFYEGTLGLTLVSSQGHELSVYQSGNTRLNVYRSRFAGTNQATAVTWSVENIESVVADLKAKGVAFEHYQMPGNALENDVYVHGSMKVAWFKDPDGNILNLTNR